MITLTTDFMLEPLSYEIVNLFTRVVVDKTLSLVGTSQYFKFEDGKQLLSLQAIHLL